MKVLKLSLGLLCLLVSSLLLRAQQPTIADQQTLINEVVVEEFDFLQKKSLENRVVIYPNTVFQIVEKTEIEGQSYSVIKPVSKIEVKKKKTKDSSETPTDAPKFEEVKLQNYYLLKTQSLEDNQLIYTPKSWKMRVGVANIPVKFFLPNKDRSFDFSTSSVSLGATLGIAQQISERKSDLWINYLFSMNFTQVTPRSDDFDSDNFDGNSLAALSPALGVALSFDQAEIGLLAGKDFLPGSAADAWKFNGKTWFSISIGTTFALKNND